MPMRTYNLTSGLLRYPSKINKYLFTVFCCEYSIEITKNLWNDNLNRPENCCHVNENYFPNILNKLD